MIDAARARARAALRAFIVVSCSSVALCNCASGSASVETPACAKAPACVEAPASAKAPTAEKLTQIHLSGDRLSVDGAPVDTLARGALRRSERLATWLERHVQEPNVAELYQLLITGDSDAAQLKTVTSTAAAAGLAHAMLYAEGRSVRLLTPAVAQQGANAPTTVVWPERPLVLLIERSRIELWRLRVPEASGSASTAATPPVEGAAPASDASTSSPPTFPRDAADEPLRVGSVPVERVDNDLPRLLSQCTVEQPCDPAVVHVADDVPAAMVRHVLVLLSAAVDPARTSPPTVELRLLPPDAVGDPPNVEFPRSVQGSLPPEVIQRIVRSHYSQFRDCYEQGLRRNPALTGRVTVRFVIGRDGSVLTAAPVPDTRFPDGEVVRCIVREYRTLRFPAPQGGVVTAIYPILFASG
jgi:hypothetical protein